MQSLQSWTQALPACPAKGCCFSWCDAMVHVLESFVTSNAPPTNYGFSQRQNSNLVTRSFAREAFSLLYHNLPTLVEDPRNMERLLKIQLGAYYAGISLFNSGSGIAGAISYPLGVHYKFLMASVVECSPYPLSDII